MIEPPMGVVTVTLPISDTKKVLVVLLHVPVKELKLYVENAQKEHNRAFFVCTLQMWASIPDLDFLGAMSQLPHLY